jgi:polyferredoxin
MKWNPLTAARRTVQAVSAVALNSNFVGSSAASRVCLPVMNCEGCALAWAACPIGLIRNALTFHEFPWIPLLLVLGIGVVVGRLFCGWVCPIGFLQDLLHRIPSRKFRLPRWTAWVKYPVLVASVFLVAWYLGGDSPYFFCNFCPTSGIMVVLPTAIADRDVAKLFEQTAKFGVTVAVVLGAIAVSRPFCKVLCPVGALVAVTNKVMPWKLHLSAKACVKCRKCDKGCPMDLPVARHQDEATTRDPECIVCHECRGRCPAGAITHRAAWSRGEAL